MEMLLYSPTKTKKKAIPKTIDFSLIKKLFGLKNKNYFIIYLKTIFPDFCNYSDSIMTNGISKNRFIEVMKLPVFISEKMFYSINGYKSDLLSSNVLINSLCNLYYGTFEETGSFIFNLYDFNCDGYIIPADVKLIFSFLPLKGDKTIVNYKYQMESLAEIENVVNDTFGDNDMLDFPQFLEIVAVKPDIFLQLLCFLYQRCHFNEDYVKILSKTNQHSVKKLPKVQPKLETDNLFSYNIYNDYNKNYNNKKNEVKKEAKTEIKTSKPKDNQQTATLRYYRFESSNLEDKIILPMQDFLETHLVSYNNKRLTSTLQRRNKNFQIEDDLDDSIELITRRKSSSTKIKETISVEKSGMAGVVCLSNVKVVIKPKTSQVSFDVKGKLSSKKSPNKLKFKPKMHTVKFTIKNNQVSLETFTPNVENQGSKNIDELLELEGSSDSDDNDLIDYEGEVSQYSEKKENTMVYWLVLRGLDIYYYSDESKKYLIKMKSILGSFVKERGEMNIRKNTVYGFQLIFFNKTRNYYTTRNQVTKEWVQKLRSSLGYRNFFDIYELIDDLGKGAYGVVKLGVHKQTNTKVAIKLILKSNFSQEKIKLIRSEIDILKFCKHPKIVKFLDHFENSDFIFIILEYIKNGDLRDYMLMEKKHNRDILESVVSWVVYQIGDALNYLHKFGIVHRDIKPENIMIDEYEKDKVFNVKLLDFGLSQIIAPKEFAKDRYGTMYYISPEIVNSEPYKSVTDIWSFGVLTYFMLCGKLPFISDSMDKDHIAHKITYEEPSFEDEIWQTRSQNSVDFIKQCLNKDPTLRITSEEVLKHPWFKMFLTEST